MVVLFGCFICDDWYQINACIALYSVGWSREVVGQTIHVSLFMGMFDYCFLKHFFYSKKPRRSRKTRLAPFFFFFEKPRKHQIQITTNFREHQMVFSMFSKTILKNSF